jgi:hypothetical protein
VIIIILLLLGYCELALKRDARNGINNHLSAWAELAPLVMQRFIPLAFHSAIHSMCQALGCLAHNRNRPPYSETGEQLFPVAAPKHRICRYRGLKFGGTPMLVHHEVRSTEDI